MKFPFNEKVTKILKDEKKRASLTKDLMGYKISQTNASNYTGKDSKQGAVIKKG